MCLKMYIFMIQSLFSTGMLLNKRYSLTKQSHLLQTILNSLLINFINLLSERKLNFLFCKIQQSKECKLLHSTSFQHSTEIHGPKMFYFTYNTIITYAFSGFSEFSEFKQQVKSTRFTVFMSKPMYFNGKHYVVVWPRSRLW